MQSEHGKGLISKVVANPTSILIRTRDLMPHELKYPTDDPNILPVAIAGIQLTSSRQRISHFEVTKLLNIQIVPGYTNPTDSSDHLHLTMYPPSKHITAKQRRKNRLLGQNHTMSTRITRLMKNSFSKTPSGPDMKPNQNKRRATSMNHHPSSNLPWNNMTLLTPSSHPRNLLLIVENVISPLSQIISCITIYEQVASLRHMMDLRARNRIR